MRHASGEPPHGLHPLHLAKLRLRFSLFRHVQPYSDEVLGRSILVLRGNDGCLLHIETSILAAIRHLAMPNLSGQDGAPKVVVKLKVLLAGLEKTWVFPYRLFAGVATNLDESGIDVRDCPIDVGDEYCLLGPLNHGSETAKFCFRVSRIGGVLDDSEQALLITQMDGLRRHQPRPPNRRPCQETDFKVADRTSLQRLGQPRPFAGGRPKPQAGEALADYLIVLVAGRAKE